MTNLKTTAVLIPQPAYSQPPQQSIIIPVPLGYEFRVVEWEDTNGKTTRVELQVKINEYDQYGNILLHGTWNPVERVRMKELK